MKKIELKEKVLSYLSDEEIKQLTPTINAILDETIDSILDGKTIVNGVIPQTEEEMMFAVSQGVKARVNILNAFVSKFDGNENIYYKDIKIK